MAAAAQNFDTGLGDNSNNKIYVTLTKVMPDLMGGWVDEGKMGMNGAFQPQPHKNCELCLLSRSC